MYTFSKILNTTKHWWQKMYILSNISIFDMLIDNESTNSETSVEVDQQVNEESTDYIIQGIIP